MKVPKTNPAKTVLTIAVGFIVVYLITEWNWAMIVSIVVGVAGIFSDYLSRKIDFLWMKLASLLGLIVPNILLGIVFYLFLFPLSILAKTFGKKDPMYLRNSYDSLFIPSDKQYTKESFEKTW